MQSAKRMAPEMTISLCKDLATTLAKFPRQRLGHIPAIWSTSFLAYMGLLGFWEKAMTTLALLGTAACLSILIGIPLGMFCARRPRFYSFIQPIKDLCIIDGSRRF